MATPRATRSRYNDLARLIVTTSRSVARTWRRMPPKGNWSQQWTLLAPVLAESVAASQREAAAAAPGYVSTVLSEVGLAEATQTATAPLTVSPDALAGIASDGRTLESLLYGAVVHAGQAYNGGAPPKAALASGLDWLTEAVATQIMDAARVADEVQTAATAPQSVSGYVRMVEPGACSRCIVLAGRFYRWNSGFLRHPGCRCVHIPAAEATAEDYRTNPNYYFDHLSRDEQDRIFGKSGAEAIRLGADISQVVNARRGMSWTGQSETTQRIINGREFTVNVHRRTAQTTLLHGQPALLTTEGTTRRGFYGGGHGGSKPGGYTGRNVGRRGAVANYTERRANRARLMPETILEHARDREDALRLLRLYGFLIP